MRDNNDNTVSTDVDNDYYKNDINTNSRNTEQNADNHDGKEGHIDN